MRYRALFIIGVFATIGCEADPAERPAYAELACKQLVLEIERLEERYRHFEREYERLAIRNGTEISVRVPTKDGLEKYWRAEKKRTHSIFGGAQRSAFTTTATNDPVNALLVSGNTALGRHPIYSQIVKACPRARHSLIEKRITAPIVCPMTG